MFSTGEIQGGVTLSPGPVLANNTPLQGKTVAGVPRALIQRAANDHVYVGDAVGIVLLNGAVQALGDLYVQGPVTLAQPLAAVHGGVAPGGSAGYVYRKNSAADYDAGWWTSTVERADIEPFLAPLLDRLATLEARVAALEAARAGPGPG